MQDPPPPWGNHMGNLVEVFLKKFCDHCFPWKNHQTVQFVPSPTQELYKPLHLSCIGFTQNGREKQDTALVLHRIILHLSILLREKLLGSAKKPLGFIY